MKQSKISKILNKYGIVLNFKQKHIDIANISSDNDSAIIEFKNALNNSIPLKNKKKPAIYYSKKKKYEYGIAPEGDLVFQVFNGFLRTYGFKLIVDFIKKKKND